MLRYSMQFLTDLLGYSKSMTISRTLIQMNTLHVQKILSWMLENSEYTDSIWSHKSNDSVIQVFLILSHFT